MSIHTERKKGQTMHQALSLGIFRLFLIPLTNMERVEEVFDSLGLPLIELDEFLEDYVILNYRYMVIMLGKGAKSVGGDYPDEDLVTWFIYDNPFQTNPTKDDALKYIQALYNKYGHGDLMELLEYKKTVGEDLNKVNLQLEDRKRYLVSKKVLPSRIAG